MVQTLEEKQRVRNIYKQAHIEQQREYSRTYKQKNKEAISALNKKYYYEQKVVLKTGDPPPTDTAAYQKKYYQANKEKAKEYTKTYRTTPEGKQSCAISRWKSRGVVHDDFVELYTRYINTENCDACARVFELSNKRCLDHDHETGKFRQVLCNRCNSVDSFKKYQQATRKDIKN